MWPHVCGMIFFFLYFDLPYFMTVNAWCPYWSIWKGSEWRGKNGTLVKHKNLLTVFTSVWLLETNLGGNSHGCLEKRDWIKEKKRKACCVFRSSSEGFLKSHFHRFHKALYRFLFICFPQGYMNETLNEKNKYFLTLVLTFTFNPLLYPKTILPSIYPSLSLARYPGHLLHPFHTNPSNIRYPSFYAQL